MSERFFVDSPIIGDRATLEGPEAHHLAHVMRIGVGEQVTLFDGSDSEFVAHVKTVGRSTIDLAIVERRLVDRETKIRLTLAVALPKGDRQRWLVEKAVELGAAALIPLITERGVAQPTDSALERLRRCVIEASKQCGRNRLLEIANSQSWRELATATDGPAARWLAHPGGATLQTIWPLNSDQARPIEIIAAIGPEGGFTEVEVQLGIASGWTAIDLGSRILRVETAALAIAAWVAAS